MAEDTNSTPNIQPRKSRKAIGIALAGGLAVAIAAGNQLSKDTPVQTGEPTNQTTTTTEPERTIIDDSDMVIPRPNNTQTPTP